MVVPHREDGGCEERIRPMCVREGRENVGFGIGDKVLIPLRSAIKAAFSVDLGRRNALRLSCVGWLQSRGRRRRKPSRKRLEIIVWVRLLGGLVANSPVG
jgi:hypothetical protein